MFIFCFCNPHCKEDVLCGFVINSGLSFKRVVLQCYPELLFVVLFSIQYRLVVRNIAVELLCRVAENYEAKR